MTSTPKTLDEFFNPAKRLRLLSPSSASLETPTPPGKLSPSHRETLPEPSAPAPASCPPLTPEKKRRMDINKALARSRRNLRLCTERIEKAKGSGNIFLEFFLVLLADLVSNASRRFGLREVGGASGGEELAGGSPGGASEAVCEESL